MDEHDLHARVSVTEERVEALRQESEKHDKAHVRIFKQMECQDKKQDEVLITLAEMRGAWALTKIVSAALWALIGAAFAAVSYWWKNS